MARSITDNRSSTRAAWPILCPGSFQGIEATGRRATVSEFTLYRVEDGKFAEVWDLTDMDAVVRQIRQGEVPLTAPADEAGTADS